MEDYYCHQCSVELGLLNPESANFINFTGSTYKLDKFIKHTLPPNQAGRISVFSDPSYETYKNYTINAMASGSTMLDQYQRLNIVWYAAKENGITFQDSVPHTTTDVVKVVLPYNEDKIHSFPINSSELVTKICKRCGRNII
jgi:hypothetical protein